MQNRIRRENDPTHLLEASPPSPQFECSYCGQRFPSKSELIPHMDKKAEDAKESSGRSLPCYEL